MVKFACTLLLRRIEAYAARPNHIFEDHPDDPSPDNEK